MEKDLKEINNEIKGYINEAKFISNKCRNKLLKMLGEAFSVTLPLDNFLNIDAQLTSDGDIIMRGDKYESTDKVKSFDELIEKYNNFKVKADKLLKKNENSINTKKDIDNILNMFIVMGLAIVYIIVIILIIRSVLSLRLFSATILGTILSSYLHPGIQNRFEQAKNYFKRKFKK